MYFFVIYLKLSILVCVFAQMGEDIKCQHSKGLKAAIWKA